MKSNNKRILLSDYFKLRITSLETERRFSTANNYRSTLNSLMSFPGTRDIKLDELTDVTLRSYNTFLYHKGLRKNSVSFYNRIIRAVYNRASHEGFIVTIIDFSGLYTGIDSTRKRALPGNVIHNIIEYDPGNDTELALSRDLFLFSFYAHGMSFVDLAYLTRSSISNGVMTYFRRKTGLCLSFHLEPCMNSIIQRYSGKGFADYVFPIITSAEPKEAYRDYLYRLHRYNLRLKEIGRACGAGLSLNSYAARHSWATLARNLHIPLSVISAGLGHTSEQTTLIYLESISQEEVDKANRQIQSYIRKIRNSSKSKKSKTFLKKKRTSD